jgi:hypothetical protein
MEPLPASILLKCWCAARVGAFRFYLLCIAGGSFVNCLWWKNVCLPAVNTNALSAFAAYQIAILEFHCGEGPLALCFIAPRL